MIILSVFVLTIVTVSSAMGQLPIGYRYMYIPKYAFHAHPSFMASPNVFAAIDTRAAAPAPAAVPVPPPGGATPGVAGGEASLAIIPALPHTGVSGFGDNLGAGIANFGNGQGAAIDALVSGTFNAAGVLISGILGSGAVNTAFQNFNNKPPPGYVTLPSANILDLKF